MNRTPLRRWAWPALALLPLALGLAGWAAARGGLLDDRRTSVMLSALPQDWFLGMGLWSAFWPARCSRSPAGATRSADGG